MIQLTLEQIEIPAPPLRIHEIEFVNNQKFRGQKIVIDNRQFENCVFENCNFLYSGGHFAFANCTIEGSTQFSPTGAAYRTINLFLALKPATEHGQPLY